MDITSKKQFTEKILTDIIKRFAIENMTSLDGFENEVYECTLKNDTSTQAYILRVGHSIHRSFGEVEREIHFLNYLRKAGLSVAEPVKNVMGNWLEKIDAHKGHFTGVLFKKAPGGVPEGYEWNESLYFNMGELTGRLHKASMGYAKEYLANGKTAPGYRNSWQQELPRFIEAYLGDKDQDLKEAFYRIFERMKSYKCTPENYGMIHFDFHGGNFFTDFETGKQRITLFDFDDCQEYWYIGDAAIALFYAMYPHSGEDIDPAFGTLFYQNFMRGYTRHMEVAEEDFKLIPDLLAIREIDLYASIKRSFPEAPDNPDNPVDVIGFMRNRKEKILSKTPVLDIDWKDY